MKVLISADMEGVTGVTFPEDVLPGHPRWEYHRPLFTEDVNAAVRGLIAGGADEVLVNEAHWDKRNLLLDRLDPRAELLIGTHKPLAMMEGIDTGVDAVAFVGYHAPAGAEGVLAHTFLANTITGVWLNGERCSEGRMNAFLAHEYGVPVVLVTGDDKACEDSIGYAPDAARVPVKTCVSRYTAVCLPPSRSAELIEAGAEHGLRARATPPAVTGPYRYEIEFDAQHFLPMVTGVPSVEITGERRVGFTLPTMYEAIRCFRAVTTLANEAVEDTYG